MSGVDTRTITGVARPRVAGRNRRFEPPRNVLAAPRDGSARQAKGRMAGIAAIPGLACIW